MRKNFLWLFLLCFVVFVKEANAWSNVFKEVIDSYVYHVEVENLAIATLKGLQKVDKKLRVGNDSSRITLYYEGKVIKVQRKPDDNKNIFAWGDITNQFIDAAIEKSTIAAERDFEIVDILASEMIKILDKDTSFYKDIDEASNIGLRNKRTFASRQEDGILYIKIAAFNKQTVTELKNILESIDDIRALIIDLKGCPGGMTGEAILAVDLFLDKGIIASTRGRNKNEETYYSAVDEKFWNLTPIFILVDGDTASSAEIFAVALQEQGLAKVIGTKTKGKGSMQKLIKLETGSVLAVTNGFFYSPAASNLDGVGVKPDVCTFEMLENKDIANLLKQQNGSCMAESREDTNFEENVALFMLKQNL